MSAERISWVAKGKDLRFANDQYFMKQADQSECDKLTGQRPAPGPQARPGVIKFMTAGNCIGTAQSFLGLGF